MRGTLAAFAGLALACSAARAEETLRPEQIPQRARELADKGRALHEAGDYPDAIVAFKEAYVLAPSPGLLFNLAQAYRLDGNCDDAAWMYRRYLDTNPLPDRRVLAEGHLATVEKCAKDPLHVAAAPTALEMKGPDAHAGGDPLAASATGEPDGRRDKQIGMWVAIGGGVSLLGAAYFAIDAHDASNTVEALYKRGAKWQDIQGTDERGHRSQALAAVLGIGGVAAAATGGVFYALGRHYEAAQHVAVAPTIHGARVTVAWRF